jgi:hypothetical protein
MKQTIIISLKTNKRLSIIVCSLLLQPLCVTTKNFLNDANLRHLRHLRHFNFLILWTIFFLLLFFLDALHLIPSPYPLLET